MQINRRFMALAMMLGILHFSSDAEAISPRRLVEITDFSSPVVSPDGRSVAFRVERASVDRNTYDTDWFVQDLDGASPPRRVADGGTPLRDSAGIPLPSPATWSPDGQRIYYRALLEGKVDVWLASADGSGAHPITLDSADVRDFVLSPDGETLYYSIGATREQAEAAEEAEYHRGVRIDDTVPIGQGLFRSGNIEGRPATQRYSGIWFDRASLLAHIPDQWKAVHLPTGETSNSTRSQNHEAPAAFSGVPDEAGDLWKLSPSPQGDRVAMLVRTGNRNGLRHRPHVQLWATHHRGTNAPTICDSDACTNRPITGMQWRPNSREILFTVTDPNEGLAQSIYRWNLDTGAVHHVVASSGLFNGGRDHASECGASSAALVCVVADANTPPRLERVDIESGERKVLFEPNAALAYDMARLLPVRMLRWQDARGQTFTGQYYAPARGADEPPPLFVNYYRCSGFIRGGLGDEWPFASLALNGVAALCINSAPSVLDAVARYSNGLAAVESAVDVLASKGRIDPSRVGVGGLSFGSEVALWIAMNSSLAQAVSVSSPSVSQNYYLFGSLKGDAFLDGLEETWGLRAPEQTPDRWRILSPTFNLHRIRAPILFQMVEQEYMQALDYIIPLLKNNRADLYVFPMAPHQKFQPRQKLAANNRNLDWFRFWLLGAEDSDPAKYDQYYRWREMRARTDGVSACNGGYAAGQAC